ncbi:MAG: hypothetical protein ACYSU5_13590 [Planctomycetota bacterium]|jgi:hypothetical protein
MAKPETNPTCSELVEPISKAKKKSGTRGGWVNGPGKIVKAHLTG